MRILLVEDDPHLVQSLGRGLREDGFMVDNSDRVSSAMDHLTRQAYDLILLDLGLPEADGVELLRAVRAQGSRIPVIILTARSAVDDRVDGLREGADDYLPKPFAFSELLARIEAVLRRSRGDESQLAIGDFRLNRLERCITFEDRRIVLTQRETDILAYLIANRNRVVSRDELTRNVWQVRSRATPMDNVIDVTMSRLRKKLVESVGSPILETVRGVGYQVKP